MPSVHPEKGDRMSGLNAGGGTRILQTGPLGIVKVTGVVYAPEGQPVPDTLNATDVLESMRTSGAKALKVAVIVLGESMTTTNGFAVPVADPLHPLNEYPCAGVAVNC